MRKDHENVLVIDIGSGSVGLGLVSNYKTGSKNDSKKNIINFCTRYELEYTNEVNFGTSPEKMLSGIENSLKQIPKQTIVKINGYIVPDPFNKKVDGCEFLLSLAFAPSNVVASIENLCLKFFALNKKN